MPEKGALIPNLILESYADSRKWHINPNVNMIYFRINSTNARKRCINSMSM